MLKEETEDPKETANAVYFEQNFINHEEMREASEIVLELTEESAQSMHECNDRKAHIFASQNDMEEMFDCDIVNYAKRRNRIVEAELEVPLQQQFLSYYHPYYNGPFGNLDEAKIRQFQIEDKILEEGSNRDLVRDSQGRILLKEHRLTHVVVANHVMNRHSSADEDIKAMKQFSFQGLTRKKINEAVLLYKIYV